MRRRWRWRHLVLHHSRKSLNLSAVSISGGSMVKQEQATIGPLHVGYLPVLRLASSWQARPQTWHQPKHWHQRELNHPTSLPAVPLPCCWGRTGQWQRRGQTGRETFHPSAATPSKNSSPKKNHFAVIYHSTSSFTSSILQRSQKHCVEIIYALPMWSWKLIWVDRRKPLPFVTISTGSASLQLVVEKPAAWILQ